MFDYYWASCRILSGSPPEVNEEARNKNAWTGEDYEWSGAEKRLVNNTDGVWYTSSIVLLFKFALSSRATHVFDVCPSQHADDDMTPYDAETEYGYSKSVIASNLRTLKDFIVECSHEQRKALVEAVPDSIQFFYYRLRTRSLCLLAVQKNVRVIRHLSRQQQWHLPLNVKQAAFDSDPSLIRSALRWQCEQEELAENGHSRDDVCSQLLGALGGAGIILLLLFRLLFDHQ